MIDGVLHSLDGRGGGEGGERSEESDPSFIEKS